MSRFTTARAFATHIGRVWGARYVHELNMLPGDMRLKNIVERIKRHASWELDNGGIEYKYYEAAAGIEWTFISGRLNGESYNTIRVMKTRQILELIYDVRMNCTSWSDIATFLMKKFTSQAA